MSGSQYFGPDGDGLAAPFANFGGAASAQGGIYWGARITGDDAEDAAAIDHVASASLAVMNEAQFLARANLADRLRAAHVFDDSYGDGLDVYLAVNAWGVWDRPSVYFPLQADLRSFAASIGALLPGVVDSGGRWPTVRLLDFRCPELRAYFVARVIGLVQRYGVDGVFLDECHRDPAAVYPAGFVGWTEADALAWRSGQRQIVRQLAAATARRPMINGTMESTGVGPARYLQNVYPAAIQSWTPTILNALAEQPRATRRLVIQCPDASLDTAYRMRVLGRIFDCYWQAGGFIQPWRSLPTDDPALDPNVTGAGEVDGDGVPVVVVSSGSIERRFERGVVSYDDAGWAFHPNEVALKS